MRQYVSEYTVVQKVTPAHIFAYIFETPLSLDLADMGRPLPQEDACQLYYEHQFIFVWVDHGWVWAVPSVGIHSSSDAVGSTTLKVAMFFW